MLRSLKSKRRWNISGLGERPSRRLRKLKCVMIFGALLSLSLVLVGCATQAPNIRVHREIPFYDAPEAVWAETFSGKTGLVDADLYAEMRPYMLMIHVDDWAKLKLFIMEMCRKSNAKCDTQLDSVSDALMRLDKLVEKYFLFEDVL